MNGGLLVVHRDVREGNLSRVGSAGDTISRSNSRSRVNINGLLPVRAVVDSTTKLRAHSILVVATILLVCSPCGADDLKLNQPAFKSQKTGLGDSAVDSYAFTAESAFDILNDTASTDLYDPLTIQTLKRLKEDARPAWDGDDEDVDKTRRVVERALAIQSGRNISSTLEQSELRSTYRAIKQGLKNFQNNFRYSLQTTGKSMEVSKEKKGKKLLELNVELNLKQGLDPQLKMGEHLRFRYDYTSQRPLLEYGFRF